MRPVGHLGQLQVVGDHHQGLAVGLHRQLQKAQHILAGFAVQVAGGLVGQKDGGLGNQGPGDGHPLLAAAGKFVGKRVQPLFQVQQFHDLVKECRVRGAAR